MKKYVIVVMSLVFSCIPMSVTWAAYDGPTEIFSTPISNTSRDDGADIFALQFYIRGDGTYIEVEGTNICLYGPSGLIRKIDVSNATGVYGDIHFIDQYIFIEGFGSKKSNLYVYDYEGNLKSTINSYSGDFEAALSNGDFITNTLKTTNYYRYSMTGQLLKTFTSKPLELGVVQKQSLGNRKYKTTVTYDDKVFVIVDREYFHFQRDGNKNIYAVEPGFVNKFNQCGKLLGQVKMPSDVVFREKNVTEREPEFMVHERYGESKLDIHGNVYTWKMTPSRYSILKWTWQDDPNVLSGPDAPTNLAVTGSTSGLYLTWSASPQDPGCVTGYEVSRATTAGGVTSTIATVNAGTVKYNDTTASSGTTYYYKVRAVAGSEFSPYTAEVSGKR